MQNIDSSNKKQNIKQEEKNLVKNSFYTYITNYGNLIFGLIVSFFIAKIITKEEWGIFILANSIILIIIIISSYFPPAIDYSLTYFLSRFSILNQEDKIKPFIKQALIFKLIFLIPIFIFSIFLFILFANFFHNYLGQNLEILFILSPIIIITGLNPILYGINRGLNMYKIIFLTSLITSCIQIITFLICFIFLSDVSLELFAIINVIAYLIPFIYNSIITIKKIKKTYFYNNHTSKFKKFHKKSINYGLPISFGYLVYGLWDQIQIQGVALLNNPELITGYKISATYSRISNVVLSSLSYPLITSFSRLDSEENNNKIESIYKLVVKFSLFVLLIVSGLLYLSADFFLITIYGDSYLVYSDIVKLMIIATIFKIVITPFDALIFARKQVKIIPYLRLTMLLIYIILFFPLLFLYGIIGALFGIIISNVIVLILYLLLTIRYLKIKLSRISIIKQYLSFFLAFVITVLLENLIFYDLNYRFFQTINLSLLKHLPLLSILSFLLIFFLTNSIFRTISRSEIEIIESFFNKEKKIDNVILKGLKILKKIF